MLKSISSAMPVTRNQYGAMCIYMYTYIYIYIYIYVYVTFHNNIHIFIHIYIPVNPLPGVETNVLSDSWLPGLLL